MKNILLIEDRPERKKQFLESSEIKTLSNYPFLKEVSFQELNIIKQELLSNEKPFLNDYDLIMTHKSALTFAEQDSLVTLKSSVFFSGGISQSFYSENPNPVLHINSKEFYSNNLIEFLTNIQNNNEIELLILQFGQKWKLNLLLNLRDKLTQKIYSKISEEIYPEDFDELFTEKLMTLNWESDTRKEIEILKSNGMDKNDFLQLDELKNKISTFICNEIGIIK